jgi:pyrimidine deaminase RibD-like protein
MEYAMEQARKSRPSPEKFCVGAVLVDAGRNEILSTGFSMELPGYMEGDGGNTHAEQCCLIKLAEQNGLPTVHPEDHLGPVLSADTVLYTTVEPCNERLSGHTTCATRILKLKEKIRTVYIGILEPDTFIPDNQGIARMRDAGVKVVVLDDPQLRMRVTEVAMAGH